MKTTLQKLFSSSQALFALALFALVPFSALAMNTTGWVQYNNDICGGTSAGYFYAVNPVATFSQIPTSNLPADYTTPGKYCIDETTCMLGQGSLEDCFYVDNGTSLVSNSSYTSIILPAGSAPTVTLTASPPSIVAQNGSSNLAWTTGNSPTSCTINNGVGTVSTAGGNTSVSPSTSTTYTITCTNAYGSANASATVTVTQPPNPTDSITVNGSSSVTITAGNSVTVAWGATNATSCSINNGIGSVSASGGSVTQYPSSSMTYTITCSGLTGTTAATASASVTVTPVPADMYASFTAAEQNLTATAGQPVSVQATVGNNSSTATGVPVNTTFWFNSSQSTSGASYKIFSSCQPSGCPGNWSETEGTNLDSTFTYTFNTPGTYYYEVCADEDQNGSYTVTDSNTANNCSGWGTITVQAAPDLTATTPSPFSDYIDSVHSFTDTISNLSLTSSATSGFHSIMQLCDYTNSTYCGTYDLVTDTGAYGSTIPPNSSGSVTASGISDPHTAGTYYYRFCANEYATSGSSFAQSSETETDYSNNCSGWAQFTDNAPYVVCSITSPSGTIYPGTPISYAGSEYGFAHYATLTWDGGATGSTYSNSYSSPGLYTVQLVGSYGGGIESATTTCSVTVSSPNVTLAASPDRVAKNTTGVGLTWTSGGLTDPNDRCVLSRGDIGTVDSTQSTSTTYIDPNAILSQTLYTIACGNGVSSSTASTTVNIIPGYSNF